jgi:hypothetical protein
MNVRSLTQRTSVIVIGTVLFFAVAFVVAVALNGLADLPWGNWHAILGLGVIVSVLGAFYGTIVALDGESGMSQADRPILRAVLCGALAALVVVLVQVWPPRSFNVLGPATGFLVGAVLGWFGWSWAKYVDF